ncbi:G-type lectin S-receptor-like serine/threonine-protein kinase At1g61480 [Sorghum bicolor]|uniref:Protein kinase domain-containing protein n=1 Tax=Sorghum bicolor TaxID=4558 RepID=A0A1Z5RKF4_SORBI|nr:G-type lectin S-receptor-like serine/threonine-protein kinase At1g61480 [Sorghum bicolor]OQU83945.1 hypothetical protein SORBI_3005G203200 [Sorghum bicolor]|eukprot:XP_021317388.1 G-type lectin S-receptor-like serine/threonine-protein kinase At1g61480 [Sorghum bicolor]
MDGGLVTQIINVLNSISTMMMKVPKNKKKCREMRGLMDALREELEPLTEGVMDTSVQAALQRFKDTLVSTETEVKKLQDGNDLVQFFQANRTAAKLNQLRQDLSQSMLHSALVASVSTTNQFRRMDQKIDYAISLLESLQSKHRTDDSTNDATNQNKTSTRRAGLRDYSWSDLDRCKTSSSPISQSNQSAVYKGELYKMSVAIKEFLNVKTGTKKRFVNELRMILKLRHRNIVEFLGYCFESDDILVVDQGKSSVEVQENRQLCFVSRYMSKGSMIRVTEGKERFKWPTVFKIIQGIADGVHYMHKERVVHLDLKPKSILLDDNMIPKINDFGTAKELGPEDVIRLGVKTLPGLEKRYRAPELSLDEPRASTKSDVYSFGVMLLETISHMCATTKEHNRLPSSHEEWINRIQLQPENEFTNLFDKKLVTDQYVAMATKCVLVGVLCSLRDPKHRPSMQQVVSMLATGEAGSTRTSPQDKNQGYTVFTQDVLETQQEFDIDAISKALGIQPGVAELLLQNYDWSIVRVQTEWQQQQQDDDRPDKLLNDMGLTIDAAMKPVKPSTQVRTCMKCRGSFNAGLLMSPGCSHYYCNGCWSTHLEDELANKGVQHYLPLRCPSSSCNVPVLRDLVNRLPDGSKGKKWYLKFLFDSYLDNSGGRTMWCPAPKCGLAIMFDDDRIGVAMDVVCSCGHRFCSRCHSSPHKPKPCMHARLEATRP